MKIFARILTTFFAVGVGFFSLRYLNFEVQDLLHSKANSLLDNYGYWLAFYSHVVLALSR